MACNSKTASFLWTTIFADSTTLVFIPCTPWMRSASVKSVRISWEMRGLTGTLEATPRME